MESVEFHVRPKYVLYSADTNQNEICITIFSVDSQEQMITEIRRDGRDLFIMCHFISHHAKNA